MKSQDNIAMQKIANNDDVKRIFLVLLLKSFFRENTVVCYYVYFEHVTWI